MKVSRPGTPPGNGSGPAGLDLGGEGPEEIAQAIVAEIVAVKRHRSAASSVTAPDRSTTGPGRERKLAPVDASSGQTVPLNVSQSFGSPPR